MGQPKSKSPFLYVDAILGKKAITPYESGYPPFVVNRSLGHHMDCVLYANEMNQRWQLDGQMQYEYLLNTVQSRYREFAPWIKEPKGDEDVELLMEYYNYSKAKAVTALKLYPEDELERLKERIKEGTQE